MLSIFRNKFFAAVIVVLIGLVVAAGVFLNNISRDLPDIGDVKGVIKSQTTYIYASDGTLITRLFQENRTIVPINKISPTFQEAVISVEDQRFYEHKGVDYIRIIGALIRDVKDREAAQGGSTITQQYVKNAYFSPEKTFERKIREALLAMKLERTYKKEEVLEKYLNTIYFGNGAYGIEAAAQSYFGVPASKLNVEQSALLAGMIKAPNNYNPYTNPVDSVKRRNLVINLMSRQGYIGTADAEAAKARPLSILPKQRKYQGIAPYYAEWIKSELNKIGFKEKEIYSQGLRVHTTLDPKMQESAELAWRKYLPSPDDPDIAIVSVEPKSGAVKAMVGGKDFNTQKINLVTQGPGRQPGSAFKPFVLTAALMNGVSPDDGFVSTSPATFKVAGGPPWTVSNSSKSSGDGYANLRRATAMSINVVYADLILKVGVDKVVTTARDLGIKSNINKDPAIALGGLDHGVHPLEMAAAYSTFANNGVRNRPYGIEKVAMSNGEVIYKHKPAPKQVIDKAVAYLVTDLLKGVIQSGTGTRANIGRPAAGKTGTTTEYADAWFCGYTPDLATAVWVGYREENKPMRDVHGIRVTGGSFPAQIWATFMKKALKGVKSRDFDRVPSSSFVSVLLDDETNLIPSEFCPKSSYHKFVKKYKPKSFDKCDAHSPILVPNLIGLSQADAESKLTELKLAYNVTKKPFNGPPGSVVDQNPAPETGVKEGTVIELSIGIESTEVTPDNQGTAVPDVVGLTAEKAISKLEGEGFVVVSEYRLSNMPANEVIGQRPPAGYIAERGASIVIVISEGSGRVNAPDVRGEKRGTSKEDPRDEGPLRFRFQRFREQRFNN